LIKKKAIDYDDENEGEKIKEKVGQAVSVSS
jgi:hypothetical protein